MERNLNRNSRNYRRRHRSGNNYGQYIVSRRPFIHSPERDVHLESLDEFPVLGAFPTNVHPVNETRHHTTTRFVAGHTVVVQSAASTSTRLANRYRENKRDRDIQRLVQYQQQQQQQQHQQQHQHQAQQTEYHQRDRGQLDNPTSFKCGYQHPLHEQGLEENQPSPPNQPLQQSTVNKHRTSLMQTPVHRMINTLSRERDTASQLDNNGIADVAGEVCDGMGNLAVGSRNTSSVEEEQLNVEHPTGCDRCDEDSNSGGNNSVRNRDDIDSGRENDNLGIDGRKVGDNNSSRDDNNAVGQNVSRDEGSNHRPAFVSRKERRVRFKEFNRARNAANRGASELHAREQGGSINYSGRRLFKNLDNSQRHPIEVSNLENNHVSSTCDHRNKSSHGDDSRNNCSDDNIERSNSCSSKNGATSSKDRRADVVISEKRCETGTVRSANVCKQYDHCSGDREYRHFYAKPRDSNVNSQDASKGSGDFRRGRWGRFHGNTNTGSRGVRGSRAGLIRKVSWGKRGDSDRQSYGDDYENPNRNPCAAYKPRPLDTGNIVPPKTSEIGVGTSSGGSPYDGMIKYSRPRYLPRGRRGRAVRNAHPENAGNISTNAVIKADEYCVSKCYNDSCGFLDVYERNGKISRGANTIIRCVFSHPTIPYSPFNGHTLKPLPCDANQQPSTYNAYTNDVSRAAAVDVINSSEDVDDVELTPKFEKFCRDLEECRQSHHVVNARKFTNIASLENLEIQEIMQSRLDEHRKYLEKIAGEHNQRKEYEQIKEVDQTKECVDLKEEEFTKECIYIIEELNIKECVDFKVWSTKGCEMMGKEDLVKVCKNEKEGNPMEQCIKITEEPPIIECVHINEDELTRVYTADTKCIEQPKYI